MPENEAMVEHLFRADIWNSSCALSFRIPISRGSIFAVMVMAPACVGGLPNGGRADALDGLTLFTAVTAFHSSSFTDIDQLPAYPATCALLVLTKSIHLFADPAVMFQSMAVLNKTIADWAFLSHILLHILLT